MNIKKEIIDNFEFFEDLVKGDKLLNEQIIYLEEKKSRKDWSRKVTQVSHKTIEDDISLYVEKCKLAKKYGIGLICRELMDKPYFRFESEGPAHRNSKEGILLSQQVPTPHFHTYDEKGCEYAFRTEVLENEKESKAIVEEIDFGFHHFCKTANVLFLDDNSPPEIKLKVPTLFDEIKGNNDSNVDFKI